MSDFNTTTRKAACAATRHWRELRINAVILVPLSIWFVVSLLSVVGAPHATAAAWLSSPVNAVLTIALALLVFRHSALGLHEAIEDYVHAPGLKKAALWAVDGANIVLAALVVLAVADTAFWG